MARNEEDLMSKARKISNYQVARNFFKNLNPDLVDPLRYFDSLDAIDRYKMRLDRAFYDGWQKGWLKARWGGWKNNWRKERREITRKVASKLRDNGCSLKEIQKFLKISEEKISDFENNEFKANELKANESSPSGD
ncbi:MAG: hypothetical protein LBS60_13595 [Deltaproteobacteria bacterium]|jgi:hypothetical protein|nr:hypothetical protein [Deltaproteobacteria bacterium]